MQGLGILTWHEPTGTVHRCSPCLFRMRLMATMFCKEVTFWQNSILLQNGMLEFQLVVHSLAILLDLCLNRIYNTHTLENIVLLIFSPKGGQHLLGINACAVPPVEAEAYRNSSQSGTYSKAKFSHLWKRAQLTDFSCLILAYGFCFHHHKGDIWIQKHASG